MSPALDVLQFHHAFPAGDIAFDALAHLEGIGTPPSAVKPQYGRSMNDSDYEHEKPGKHRP